MFLKFIVYEKPTTIPVETERREFSQIKNLIFLYSTKVPKGTKPYNIKNFSCLGYSCCLFISYRKEFNFCTWYFTQKQKNDTKQAIQTIHDG